MFRLVRALNVLRGLDGVGRVEFDKKDIVRAKLVQRIVEAYERYDKRMAESNDNTDGEAPAETPDNNQQ